MNKLIIPEVSVRDEEYKRLLGFPSGYKPDGRSAELAEWARKWYEQNGNPWIYFDEVREITYDKNGVMLNGLILCSEKLRTNFEAAGVDRAIIAIASAGKECEEFASKLWFDEKPDECFYMDTYGSVVTEHLMNIASAEVCKFAEEINYSALPHYSPGFTGWNIEDQVKLFNIVKKDNIGDKISMLDTGMLKPRKSMLALFGLSSAELDGTRRNPSSVFLNEELRGVQNPCHFCDYDCAYRRYATSPR